MTLLQNLTISFNTDTNQKFFPKKEVFVAIFFNVIQNNNTPLKTSCLHITQFLSHSETWQTMTKYLSRINKELIIVEIWFVIS
jgi:hypothetical protein